MRRVIATLVALALAATPQVALADHITGDTGWYIEYNAAGTLDDNYTQKSYADNVSDLQPGDDITLTVELRHTNDTAGDWYLTNQVLKSLEDGDATGSAYGYKLSYEGPSNSRTLYESETVGGTGSAEGLAEATNAMDDYFYLGTLSKGETAKVTVNVSLDGETEGNAYFDTLARLQLKFAVEENPTGSTTRETNKTNEENKEVRNDTNRTQRTTQSTPRNNERVTEDTPQNVRRTNDRTTQSVDRNIEDEPQNENRVIEREGEPQNVNRVIEGEPQNVENIEYVYVDGGSTPATTVVNRVIPGSTSGLAKTGDRTTNFPLYAAMVGAGLVVLAIAIRIVRKRGANEKGDLQ